MSCIVENKILSNCLMGRAYKLSDIFAGVVFGFLDSLRLIFDICKFRMEGFVDEEEEWVARCEGALK
jgi:hypothetical protein